MVQRWKLTITTFTSSHAVIRCSVGYNAKSKRWVQEVAPKWRERENWFGYTAYKEYISEFDVLFLSYILYLSYPYDTCISSPLEESSTFTIGNDIVRKIFLNVARCLSTHLGLILIPELTNHRNPDSNSGGDCWEDRRLQTCEDTGLYTETDGHM